MSALDTQAAQVWLPGQGLVPTYLRQAMKAVEEYDDGLSLGRHEHTGEWVVMLKRGPMTEPHPVFGLGVELPAPEEIKKRLYQADVRRHGGKIAQALDRADAARRKKARDEVNDQTGVAAEAMEWAHRKMGTHPAPRIFVPKGVS
jgi:hypothetical protein